MLLELKRRLSTSDVEDEEETDQTDATNEKMQRAEVELKKFENESSIAKVVVHDLAVRLLLLAS